KRRNSKSEEQYTSSFDKGNGTKRIYGGSQFAICASLWQVPDLLDFLGTGQNLWSYLFDALNVSSEARELAKPVFKEAIYSICYGMPRKSLNWTIGCNLTDAKLNKEMAHEFSQVPLIQTLLNARDAALETIDVENGAMK